MLEFAAVIGKNDGKQLPKYIKTQNGFWALKRRCDTPTARSHCVRNQMLEILANRTYRHLLAAQVIALVGTGLATVALGLLAYDLAGGSAGAVLGTALAIKMVAEQA
jgi:hypothetical protein